MTTSSGNKMEKRLHEFIENTGIAGLSAAVIDQQVRNYSLGKMGKIPPFSEQTVSKGAIYDLASLTKVIGTTTRILQLVQSRQLTLLTQVAEILPRFSQLTMTIEDLLLHRSGLPADFSDKSRFSSRTLMQFFKTYEQPAQTKKVNYSDIGYLLLGMVIEAIDGTDLERSFQRYIFRPLGMKDTTYFPKNLNRIVPTESTEERGLILGEVHDSKAFQLGRPAGSAGLFSTLEDLTAFTKAMMEEQGQSVLFTGTVRTQLLQTYQQRTLGWEKPFGETIIYHTGFTGTSIGIDLKQKRALILLTNRIHPTRDTPYFMKERYALYREFFKEEQI
ncbi:serine hydrolase [Enterococcus sp. 3G1_DIV0629]|uniref:serine hydrolase domain-containing protein n=1 Tax=Enterococcus sp. (strain 3G1_DIV0629) TaxID=1834176 RepID=UPI000A33AB92|nr:serine hydrolase domain-containing protein [Enterococcus sp. 3G1_DIV0629]EME7218689.1 beta-lactamase family protein [Enterococcus faecium]EME8123666.1 beta-lactamase family protein [Enterococcus faecium]